MRLGRANVLVLEDNIVVGVTVEQPPRSWRYGNGRGGGFLHLDCWCRKCMKLWWRAVFVGSFLWLGLVCVIRTRRTGMSKILEVGENFWNIRGSFKLLHFIDLGTHASLVRLSGTSQPSFVLLDTVKLEDGSPVLKRVNELTDNGKNLKAIINLHPFHTIYVESVHKRFPNAELYGTKRHHDVLKDLPWKEELTEESAFQEKFKADLEFSVPRGIQLVTDDPNVHTSSVIAYHLQSKTIHVDDTFNYVNKVPLVLRPIISPDTVFGHTMLPKAFEKRPGAGADYLSWVKEFKNKYRDAQNLCAAHTTSLLAKNNTGKMSIAERIEALIPGFKSTCDKADAQYSKS